MEVGGQSSPLESRGQELELTQGARSGKNIVVVLRNINSSLRCNLRSQKLQKP